MAAVLVVPAAGYGTRMAALSGGLPKELMPVAGRPALLFALAEGLRASIERAVIVTRAGKPEIERFVRDEDYAAGLCDEAALALRREVLEKMEVRFALQPAPRGEADALWRAREPAKGADPAVHYPDNVFVGASGGSGGALAHLATHFAPELTHLAGLTEVDEAFGRSVSNAGRVDLAPGEGEVRRIRAFLPKGPGCFVPRFAGERRTCGIYLARAGFFDHLEAALAAHGQGEVTDSMVRRRMLAAGEAIHGQTLPGRVYDVGNPAGYAAACAALDPALP